jgi:hypothetical protein
MYENYKANLIDTTKRPAKKERKNKPIVKKNAKDTLEIKAALKSSNNVVPSFTLNESNSNTSVKNIANKDDHLSEILKYLINLGNLHLDRGHVIIRGNHKTSKTAFANSILNHLEQFIHEGDIPKYNLIKLDARETKTKASIYNTLFKFLFSNCKEDPDAQHKFKSVNTYLRFNTVTDGLDLKMLETDIFVILLDQFELLKEEDQLHMKNLFDCIRNEAMAIIIVAVTNNDAFNTLNAMIDAKHLFRVFNF